MSTLTRVAGVIACALSLAACAGPEPTPVDPLSPQAAVAVLEGYFSAVNDGDRDAARDAWANHGELADADPVYRARRVRATIGSPGRIEPGAGQRYIEIPVTVEFIGTDGAPRTLSGSYVLHRTVVDGASDAQRRWHLHEARL